MRHSLEELIMRVRPFDESAADFLETLKDDPNRDYYSLAAAFEWILTPQGSDYWDDLNRRIRYEGGYQ